MRRSAVESHHKAVRAMLVWIFGLALCPALARADIFTLSATSSMDSQPDAAFVFFIDPTQLVVASEPSQYFATYAQSDEFGEFYAAFGSSTYAANLGLYGQFGILNFSGAQLYSGDESSPTFLEGTFDLTSLDGTAYKLAITSNTAVTPEPPSLLLLFSGGCWVGAGIRPRLRSGRRFVESTCRILPVFKPSSSYVGESVFHRASLNVLKQDCGGE